MDMGITNPPTPPLDENSLNDLPGEPISPDVSDSDVYLNADDTFDQDHQTSTSSTFQNNDAIQNAEESSTNALNVIPSELDTDPTLATDLQAIAEAKVETVVETKVETVVETIVETEVERKVETIVEIAVETKVVETLPSTAGPPPDTGTSPVDESISDSTAIEDDATNPDIRDNETAEEPVKKDANELELGEKSEDPSTLDHDNKSIQNDMEVDSDDRHDAEDVEMKDVEDKQHSDLDHDLSTAKESQSNTDGIGDEPTEQVTDDQENVDNELHPTSDQSGKNLDDSDSFQNDSTSNEKHHTEEVDMENVENVRDTTDKTAEDPFDAVRSSTVTDDLNTDAEKQDRSESQNKEHDEMDVHNETEKDDGNESHDETTTTGGKFTEIIYFG